MTNQPLSPAAQAIWNAYLDNTEWEVTQCELKAVAAALRALQRHVAPLDDNVRQAKIRCDIRDIATELENHQ